MASLAQAAGAETMEAGPANFAGVQQLRSSLQAAQQGQGMPASLLSLLQQPSARPALPSALASGLSSKLPLARVPS